MPVMVGGGDRRADRNVMCVLLPLAVVLLLSAGVAASPEEPKPVQEQPVQEVQAYTFLNIPIKPFIVVGRRQF